MPSEFDQLVAELSLRREVKQLTKYQTEGFIKALGDAVIGCRPDERRCIQDALKRAKARSGTATGDVDRDGISDDAEIAAAAEEGRMRSDAEAARAEGIRPKKKADLRMELEEMERTRAEVAPIFAKAMADVRAMQRAQTRERVRGLLSKALSAFHRGELTGHQVAVLEAKAHRLMAAAAEPAR